MIDSRGQWVKRSGTTAVRRQAVPPLANATATSAAPPAPHGNVPVITTEQFHRAYEVARLAAEQKAPEVSLRAMREAVRGGPPVPPANNRNRGGGRYTSRMINGVQYLVEEGAQVHIAVDQALLNLVPKWRALGVQPAVLYDVLAAAVLPAARPAEVFLYADAPVFGQVYIQSGGVWTPTTDPVEGEVQDRGLGQLLAEVAVEAGKVDDLRARVEARAGQPLGELPAHLLLATLALRAKDEARALEQFKALGERLRKDSQQNTNERIAAVLLPAFADPKYSAALAPLVEKAAENFATANNTQKAMETRFKLAEYHLRASGLNPEAREAAARAQYKLVEGYGARVGRGEFNVHLPLAKQYLKHGWADDALRELGLHADHITAAGADPRMRHRRPEPTLEELPQLVRLLLDLPAARRYEALKGWSLPSAGRKSVRYYVGVTPKELPPPQFVKLPPVPANKVVSTLSLLAEAAKECGKADELIAEADKLVAEKVDNAELLQVLAHVVGGRGAKAEPVVKAFAEAAHKRLTDKPEQAVNFRYYYEYENSQPAPFHPSEFLVAALCLADPALAGYGEGLLGPMLARAQTAPMYGYAGQAPPNVDYVGHIRSAWDRLGAARAGAADGLAGGEPPHWFNATARALWFAQDGYLVQAWNDQPSHLLIDTPLAGTFEFSVDAYQGHSSDGQAGYAGVVYGPGSSGVWQVSQSDRVNRPAAGARAGEFNRLTVQVSPGKVRCLLNGQLFYEDTDPPPTSPWLMLAGSVGGRPVYRNFALSGQPQVLPEVKLTAGDSLGGWMTHIYAGSMPQRLLPREQTEGVSYDQYGNPTQDDKKEKVYDWQAKDGEILGRKLDRPGERPAPSKLAYVRPLRPGDTLRYEFFYEPGKTHVHPSLGRLAFLLEPDGVKLHWLTDKTADDWTGLAADNAVDDPAGLGNRGQRTEDRGQKGKLPLKAGEWNAVTLTGTADGVAIALNGTTVYEAKLSPEIERLFGLFHYRDRTAVRVRNVVLAGSWPKALSSPAEIGFATKPPSPAVARARRWQLGEHYYFTEAGDVVARAQALPPAERFKALAAWVLPNESRPTFQLAGVTKPLDVLGVVDQKPNGERNGVGPPRRVMLGGRFEAPCLELVAAAKEAGTLDALADGLAKMEIPAFDELSRRSRTALLAVIRAAQGRDADAADLLKQLRVAAEKMRPGAHGPERWPDLIAVTGTLDRPALLAPATELAQAMNKNLDMAFLQMRMFEDFDWWVRAARGVRAQSVMLAKSESGGATERGSNGARGNGTTGALLPRSPAPLLPRSFAYWESVPGVDANSRGQGWGLPHWVARDGTVTHYPGHSEDYLILRTPLRGDFEVTCELKTGGWQEAHVVYGSHEFDLGFDRKKYKLHTSVRRNGRDTTISPPLPAAQGNTYQFKLAVKDGWFRAFVDGREVAAERIGTNPDPWLMLHCNHRNTGELRNVRITGSPTVPPTIDLLASDDLGMWRPYAGGMGGGQGRPFGAYIDNSSPGIAWTKRGEEMYSAGKKPDPPEEGKPVPPRSFPESAVYYQRPLLEDGAVEYEFFYDPDKAQCHPMLDRLVFLLEPEGVKLHWLTDGPQDKSGVPFDNAADEPACRCGPSRLPLKAKAWNRVMLAVAGDTLKLSLNGTLVYERPIEPTNQRLFGLFHFTDRTEARVRSLTYAGDWPKQLPPMERLFELATDQRR